MEIFSAKLLNWVGTSNVTILVFANFVCPSFFLTVCSFERLSLNLTWLKTFKYWLELHSLCNVSRIPSTCLYFKVNEKNISTDRHTHIICLSVCLYKRVPKGWAKAGVAVQFASNCKFFKNWNTLYIAIITDWQNSDNFLWFCDTLKLLRLILM